MTGDKYPGVTLTNRQPIVLARLSEDPDRSADPAPKYPLGQCERSEWPFPVGIPSLGMSSMPEVGQSISEVEHPLLPDLLIETPPTLVLIGWSTSEVLICPHHGGPAVYPESWALGLVSCCRHSASRVSGAGLRCCADG